jgi:hypothetical protein
MSDHLHGVRRNTPRFTEQRLSAADSFYTQQTIEKTIETLRQSIYLLSHPFLWIEKYRADICLGKCFCSQKLNMTSFHFAYRSPVA